MCNNDTGNYTNKEGSDEDENDEYLSDRLFHISSSTFHRMRVFDSINPVLAKSYCRSNVNDVKNTYIARQLLGLFQKDKPTLSPDR